MKTFHILSICILIGYVIIATVTAVILGEARYSWLPAGCALFLVFHLMTVRFLTQMAMGEGGEERAIRWRIKDNYLHECAAQATLMAMCLFLAWFGKFFLMPAAFHLCWLTVTVLEWGMVARPYQKQQKKGGTAVFP